MGNIDAVLGAAVRVVSISKSRIDQSPLEAFVGMLPLLVIIIGVVIVVILAIKSEYTDTERFDTFEKTDSTSGKMLYSVMQETNEYYKNNRGRINVIFISAVISCFVGLITIMISIFYFSDYAKTAGIVSGIIITFISNIFFWLYKQCDKRVQKYFNTLIYLQKVFIAMELVKECDEDMRKEKIGGLVDALIKSGEENK